MDFPIQINTIRIGLSIIYFKGSQVENPYNYTLQSLVQALMKWLSGRVLDSRPRGHWFEPNRRHCVVVLEQDKFILAYY